MVIVRMPELIVVFPEKELLPERVRLPVPTLVRDPLPEMIPALVEEELLPPTVRDTALPLPLVRARLFADPSPPKVAAVRDPKESVPAPPAKVLPERALASPRASTPAATAVFPVKELLPERVSVLAPVLVSPRAPCAVLVMLVE